MFNLQQRLNVVSSFAMTAITCVLVVVSAISALSSYGHPISSLEVVKDTYRVVTRRYGPDHYDYRNSKSEFARLAFDLDADFTPLFNWNTKQVFVTVVAEYESKTHNRNKIVLWDRIIKNKDKANLRLRNVPNKYAMIDVSRKWSYQQANIYLHWDVTPHVGLLQSGQTPEALTTLVLSPTPLK